MAVSKLVKLSVQVIVPVQKSFYSEMNRRIFVMVNLGFLFHQILGIHSVRSFEIYFSFV